MAVICRICKVGRGSPHKFSCNYSKYRQQVQWIDNSSGNTVGYDYDYGMGDTSSSCSSDSSVSYNTGGCSE